MINDALKLNIAPWQEKGRWYHAFIESNGTSPSLTFCDLNGCTVSSSSFYMPSDIHIIDYQVVDVDLAVSKTMNYAKCKASSSGKEYLQIPAAADYTYCDIWFFAYKKNE